MWLFQKSGETINRCVGEKNHITWKFHLLFAGSDPWLELTQLLCKMSGFRYVAFVWKYVSLGWSYFVELLVAFLCEIIYRRSCQVDSRCC